MSARRGTFRRDLLTAAALFAAGLAILRRPIVSNDVWWHLAVGRELLADGAVPRLETFSHTMPGAPWVAFEWLFQAAVYFLQSVGGFGGLVWGKALVGAAAAAAVYGAVRAEGARPEAAALGSLCALVLIETRNFVRPELASLFFFPVFLHAILSRRAGGSRRALMLLPAWMLLWANLHGGFFLGLVLLALTFAGAVWERGGRLPRELGVCLLACAAASFVNPFGSELHREVLSFVRALEAPGGFVGISEWAPLGLASVPVFWVLLFASFAALLRGALSGRREFRFWLPLILVFAVWGPRQSRNASYFVFAAAPYLFGLLSRARVWERPRLRRWTWAAPAAFALWLTVPALESWRFRGPVAWEFYPQAASDFLERRGVEGVLYNDYDIGGFLEWRFGKRRPVFQDGRNLFYPLLAAEIAAERSGTGLRSHLERYGVTYALVKRPRGAGAPPRRLRFPLRRWALVYWDDSARVYVRRLPRYRALIAEYEFSLADPDDSDFFLGEIAKGRLEKRAVLAELERHRRQVGVTAAGDFLHARVLAL